MIIGIVSHKGGVGKTTTAIHISAILQKKAPCLLIDGDTNRSALSYSRRGELPFKVVDEKAAAKYAGDFQHKVIDTQAHPSKSDLAAMVEGCDHILIICEPDAMSLDVLPPMLEDLEKLGSKKHRVLLCQVSPLSQAIEARTFIEQLNVKTFKRHIRSYAAYKAAARDGITVDQVTDNYASEAWNDYLSVAKEIL